MFSPGMACLFFFSKRITLMLMKLNSHTFIFIEHVFVILRKALPTSRCQWSSLTFLLNGLGLKFRFMINFNFYYVQSSKYILLLWCEKNSFSRLSYLAPVPLVRRPQWVSSRSSLISAYLSLQHPRADNSQEARPPRVSFFYNTLDVFEEASLYFIIHF